MKKKETRDVSEVLRDEMFIRDRIIDLLQEGPMTVPDLAEALGHPSREVMRWVMAMRRYGTIVEMPKNRADDYYQYRLAE
jgi:predicted Rossmann fold nucleotide-binding protein DprA/Smf involved in DNA uptake